MLSWRTCSFSKSFTNLLLLFLINRLVTFAACPSHLIISQPTDFHHFTQLSGISLWSPPWQQKAGHSPTSSPARMQNSSSDISSPIPICSHLLFCHFSFLSHLLSSPSSPSCRVSWVHKAFFLLAPFLQTCFFYFAGQFRERALLLPLLTSLSHPQILSSISPTFSSSPYTPKMKSRSLREHYKQFCRVKPFLGVTVFCVQTSLILFD